MKKFLLSLCVWFIWFITFWYCDYIWWVQYKAITNSPETLSCNWLCCFMTQNQNASVRNWMRLEAWWEILEPFTSSYSTNQLSCFNFSWNFSYYTTSNTFLYFRFYDIPIVSNSCPTCPEVPSCLKLPTNFNVFWVNLPLSWYDQVVLDWPWFSYWGSSIITNQDTVSYVVSLNNDLTDMSWDLQYSNFYINNILHPWTENIFLNIQDNIFRDYSESESGLVVDVWSGYDQDYIDWVINVQSYRPTSEDFTQTFVGGLILFTPYVVILLFVILVWNLIKKIFKSK